MREYNKAGWLTEESMQYGGQHQQPQNGTDKHVRFRSHRVNQYIVEIINPKTNAVIKHQEFFAAAKARKCYKEWVGKPFNLHESPDFETTIVL